MELNYQKKVVAYLLQSERAVHLKRYLDKEIVDDPALQEIIGLWLRYTKEYNRNPDETILRRMVEKDLEGTEIKQETVEDLYYRIGEAYRLSPGELVEEDIVEYCQEKLTANVLDWANEQMHGKEKADMQSVIKRAQKKFQEISLIGEEQDESHGKFLVQDFGRINEDRDVGIPTFLNGLNRVTSAGGFHSPQLITIMGAPKSFKTGFLLVMAIWYMKRGLKVYYADFENGVRIIETKLHQALLNCTQEELFEGVYIKELEQILKRIKKMSGGEIRIDEFQARRHTLSTAEARLDYLEYEHGWKPDVIMWDYLDLAEVDDKSITERRLKIQHNYHSAINLNKRKGTFCFTVSKVKQSAFKKSPIDLEDFGEDSEKAYNSHAAFALVKDTDEQAREAGLAELQVVVQRQGLPPELAAPIRLLIDGARIQCTELTPQIAARFEEEEGDFEEILKEINGENKKLTTVNDQTKWERDDENVEFD